MEIRVFDNGEAGQLEWVKRVDYGGSAQATQLPLLRGGTVVSARACGDGHDARDSCCRETARWLGAVMLAMMRLRQLWT